MEGWGLGLSLHAARSSHQHPLPALALPDVLACAAVAVGILLVTSTRDGYHRDELYFLEASRHLAWGYVDQPPLSIALVALSRVLFGNSLFGLRLFPALADGGVVILTGLIARELGGERFAQGLAALGIAVSPFLIAGHLAGPTIYDFLAWELLSWLVIRILRTGNERLWLAAGVVAGVGLENKETILLLVFGLFVGLVFNGQSRLLRSRWLWMGVLTALVIWAPNLIWQTHYSWPTLEMSHNLHQEHSGLAYTLTFVPIQLLLPGWWLAPVWMAGLWALWREPRFRSYRAFAAAYVLLFVLIGVYIGDRPYYFAPLYAVAMAVGAIVADEVIQGTRRFFSTRRSTRRLLWRSRRTVIAAILIAGVIDLPISVPILPAAALATLPLQKLNYNLGETIGWQQLVATTARIYRSLPSSERSSVAIVTGNYGEAGAIDRYGGALDLPRAYSGHNSYWWWGPPHPSTGSTIAVGLSRPLLMTYFRRVVLVQRFHDSQGIENDEYGTLIWLCRGQQRPWPAIWPSFRHYG
jgi:4-amino-4-deoxy-L-arabinose transferase-like glycosyltransferase